jgi:hypothetical protein
VVPTPAIWPSDVSRRLLGTRKTKVWAVTDTWMVAMRSSVRAIGGVVLPNGVCFTGRLPLSSNRTACCCSRGRFFYEGRMWWRCRSL